MALIKIPDSMANWPVLRNLRLRMPDAAKLPNGDTILINRIAQEAADRSRKNIQTWRQCIESAEDPANPNWQPLQDLYDYLEPDAQLGTSKDIRAASTLSCPYIIYSKKTGDEIPEKTALFRDKYWFFTFAWEFIDTVLKGYTGAQLTDPTTMRFEFLPRRNMVPQKRFFRFSVTGEQGISLDDPSIKDTIIFITYKHKLGILNDIVPNLIWKKNARQAWQEFSEKFGIPMISATTNKRDKNELAKIEAMLKAMGEASTAVLPENTTIKIHDEVTKGDPYKVYQEQIKMDDEAIAKRILGGTMITDAGSSRSQSEVMERTLKDVISMFDKTMIKFVVNDYLMPMMARYGAPFTEDDAFKFDESKEIPLTDLSKIFTDLLKEGYEVEDKWVSKTFNIPISGRTKPASNNTAANFKPAPTAMAAALGALGVTLPQYQPVCGHNHKQPVAAFSEDLLSELSDLLINDVYKGQETLVNEVLKSIQSFNLLRDGLFDAWSRRMDISYDTIDHHCLAMMEYNLFEFSRLKEKANVFALNQLLIDPQTNNPLSFNAFQTKAQQYLKNPDVNWLKTEYNHSVAVGQNASLYYSFKREQDTFPYCVIHTIGDSRVRQEHRLLDGKIIYFKQKGGIALWPPFDFGCRCYVTQFTGGTPNGKEVISNAEMRKLLNITEGSKWDINRGEIEQVFSANEMYLQNNNLTEDDSLTYQSYGLKDFDAIKAKYKKLKLDKSITADNVSELFKPESSTDYMGFDDYLGRKMVMPQSVFDYHTKDVYTKPAENRHQLFPHITDVLQKPDEVYFTKYGTGNKVRYQTNYIKFYQDDVLIVNTQPGSDKVEINTWYKMKAKEEKIRSGYLVYQNKKP